MNDIFRDTSTLINFFGQPSFHQFFMHFLNVSLHVLLKWECLTTLWPPALRSHDSHRGNAARPLSAQKTPAGARPLMSSWHSQPIRGQDWWQWWQPPGARGVASRVGLMLPASARGNGDHASRRQSESSSWCTTTSRRTRYDPYLWWVHQDDTDLWWVNLVTILICSIFQDLLDRAERRDLPTAHQLLIWRDRQGNYFARKQWWNIYWLKTPIYRSIYSFYCCSFTD